MDEEVPISFWARAWERFWPLAAFLAITSCAASALLWLGAMVSFGYFPSRYHHVQIFECVYGCIVLFLLSTWIFYWRRTKNDDESPVMAAVTAAICAFSGVALELIMVVMVLRYR
jgi:hypothetical protein